VRKLKKPMDKAISEIIERLKKYPNADYELDENSIIVKENNDNGFSVSLTLNGNENYTVAFDVWHEEFDNEIDALNCFAFGLSKDCRLKTTKKGGKPIKWTVQSNENGNWIDGNTTGLINLAFWQKSDVVYLQNDLIK
ncbi:hypothetical protein, partial [Joostella atrarenae]